MHAELDESKIYDLLIVGAGPVGLATAIAAHKRGCRNIVVVDQAREFKPTGDFINVNPNGVRALRHISSELADAFCAQNTGGTGGGFRFADVDGNVLKSLHPKGPSGEPNVGTKWFTIQTMLRNAIPEDITMRINAQLIGLFDEDDGTVRADFVTNRVRSNPFAHWNRDPAAELAREGAAVNGAAGEPKTITLHARLVIAADGINSFARSEVYRQVYGEDSESSARANYSGFASYKSTGYVPQELEEDARKVEGLYLEGGRGMCLVGSRKDRAERPDAPNLMLIRVDGDFAERVGWEWKFITHTAVPESLTALEQRANGYPGLVEAVVEQLQLGGFPDFVLRLAHGMLSSEGDDEREIICRPLYIVPMTTPAPYELATTATQNHNNRQHCVGYGHIFLVGDALHGMPPFISQGTSQGWEDVVELVDLLADACGWAEGRHEVPIRDQLDLLRTKFADVRTERVSLAQTETLTRRWAFDPDTFSEQQELICNFQPHAKGW